jgi:hypothetical protein
MPSITTSVFEINGVISTDKSVLQNINTLCSAAATWMTYDVNAGKWSVIINQPGASIASFNDSNIIGGINVSGTGINELYNSVTVEFPHKDLRDDLDYVNFSVPLLDRFPNEQENNLNIQIDIINDPIQAQYIGNIELKQSRIDKVIQFNTDYSKLGLKAGDLIDVTSEMYAYTNKVFRITRIEESDENDGAIGLSITALEYDVDIYSDLGLLREYKEKATGIPPAAVNTAVQTSNAVATTLQNITGTPQVLTPGVISSGDAAINSFLQAAALATAEGFSQNNPGTSLATFKSNVIIVSTSAVQTFFNNYTGNAGYVAPSGPTSTGSIGPQNNGGGPPLNIDFVLTSAYSTFIMLVNPPLANMILYPKVNSYELVNPGAPSQYVKDVFTQVNARGFTGYIPMAVTLYYIPNPLIPTYIPVSEIYTDWQAQTAVITVENIVAGGYRLAFNPEFTYDLNQDDSMAVYHSNYAVAAQSSGGGLTVTTLGFKET